MSRGKDVTPSCHHHARRLLSAFLHALLLAGVAVDASCPTYSHAAARVISDEAVVLECDDKTKVFPSSQKRLLLDMCIGGSWKYHDPPPACESPGDSTMTSACVNPPQDPDKTQAKEQFMDGSNNMYGKYYECTGDLRWLSGYPGTITECASGQWTPVLDKCDEACDVPRDCYDIMKVGFTETTTYNVIPTGIQNDPSIQVPCEFDTDQDVWTTVLKMDGNGFGGTLEEYREGRGTPADNEYFIGLDSLLALTYEVKETTRRPLVVQFIITTDENERPYHATYNNFTFEKTEAGEFTLTSVGDYHGDAGDGFSASVGYNLRQRGTSFWWGPAGEGDLTLLETSEKLAFVTEFLWPPLTDGASRSLTHLKMRVRPRFYDDEIACPLLNVMNTGWDPPSQQAQAWMGNVSLPRLPGSGSISYTCLGDYMMEGAEGGPYTVEGFVECVNDAGQPTWNASLNLPCKLVCPEPFQLSVGKDRCYNKMTGDEEYTLPKASARCGQMNSSLAVIGNVSDLADLEDGKFYLTAHTFKDAAAGIDPPLPDDLTCSGDCSWPGEKQCVTVNTAGEYKVQGCDDEGLLYICQVPGYCPQDYTSYKGHCYKFIDTVEGLPSAQQQCEEDMAALAYPETLDRLDFLAGLNDPVVTTVLIGLNNAWEDWSAGGLYNIDGGVVNLTKQDDATYWRALSIDGAGSYSLQSVPYEDDGAVTQAFCQLHGPSGCYDDPPEPTVNMTRVWTNDTTLATVITYLCLEGYYFEGNTSVTERTVKCTGISGGWHNSTVGECYRVEVCLETLNTSELITNVTDGQHRYLNGVINFTCPDQMGAAGKATVQSLTCIQDQTPSVFRFDPPAVEPCNVCLGSPNYTSGTLPDYDETTEYTVGQSLELQCLTNYMYDIGVTTVPLYCNDTGWENATCYEGCSEFPPELGDNQMNTFPDTFALGNNVTYTCNSSYYVPPTAAGETLVDSWNVTCTDQHVWEPAEVKNCVTLCLSDPLNVTEPGNSTWDGFSRSAGTQVELTCPQDYYFGNLSSSVTLTCEEDGKWTTVDPSLLVCRMVCPQSPPAMPDNVIQEGVDAASLYWVGDNITFRCPQGQESPLGLTYVDLNCSSGSGWTLFDTNFTCHDVCPGDPQTVQPPGNSSWNNITRIVTHNVTLSCPDDYLFGDLNSTLTLTCEDNLQWTTIDESLLTCKEVCPNQTMPAQPTNSSKEGAEYPFWVGDEVTFNCEEGQESPLRVTTVTFECLSTSGWFDMEQNFDACHDVCLMEPQRAPILGNTSWNIVTRIVGYEVELSCPDPLKLGDLSQSKTVVCLPDGNWTKVDEDLLVCREECAWPTATPPTNSTMLGKNAISWVGDMVTYKCDPGMASPTGVDRESVVCHRTGWEELDPDFECMPTCASPPPEAPLLVMHNYTGVKVWGTLIRYFCRLNFSSGEPIVTSTCDQGNWSLTEIPDCVHPEGPLPTTMPPPTMPNADVHTQQYEMTTDLYIPHIQTVMEDVNGVDNNYQLVDGPFGFGYGIGIVAEKKQCQAMKDFVGNGECAHDPETCTVGLSISIWEKTIFTWEEFFGVDYTELAFNKKYIISTGGDTAGHPGIALYQHGIYLVGLVSTGAKYWTARAPGLLLNYTWTNIGMRWDETHGLEILINDHKTCSDPTGADSTRLEPLSPSELMIGCHKDSSNTEYRFYHTAEIDELAMWNRRLADANTIYFLGGFEGEIKHLEPDEFAKMLSKSDLHDPMQAAVAATVLEEMTRPADNDLSNDSSTDEEALKMKAKSFNTTLELINKLTDPRYVPDCILREDFEKSMMITKVISNLMEPSKQEDWRIYQEEYGRDVTLLCDYMGGYLMTVVQALQCNNETESKFYFHADHLYMQVTKSEVNSFGSSQRFTVPHYRKSDLEDSWLKRQERIEVPKDMFSDERCKHRITNVVGTVYENLHKMMSKPITLNPKAFNTRVENLLDSRILEVDVNCDQVLLPNKEPNPKEPICNTDSNKLKKNLVLFTAPHLDSQPTLRKLSFHAGEVKTDIYTRHCVWWNPSLGQHGAWDRYGCRVWEAKKEYTKCACQHLGKYAVIAEKIEPMEVAEEPMWLWLVRYILYGVSALCLLFYIIVVAVSGNLKEKFHLMGMTLAGMLLAGIVVMVLTDLDDVRDDRHICAGFGLAIMFVFMCAAVWVACVGHATFKCITAGILGGSLNPYLYLSVGVTMVCVGCAVTFLLHDLGNDPRCFISWDSHPKYLFFCPVLASCCVALFCTIVIFFNLRTAALRNNPTMTDYRTFSLGASFFSIYFTITWVIGLLAYCRFIYDIDFYPFFQLLNSLMGVVLLCCIGVGSSRFRMVCAGQAKRRREMFLSNINRGGDTHDTKQLGPPADETTPPTPPTRPVSPPTGSNRPQTSASIFSSRPSSCGTVAGRPGSSGSQFGF